MPDRDDKPTFAEPIADAVTKRRSDPRIAGERYRLGDEIGKGGMGIVVAARDRQLDREVAVKRMLDQDASEQARQRFVREARVQGRLDHPAIAPVYELGNDELGRPFFVMKRLAGTTLKDLLARGGRRERLLRALAEVCLAIEFAHTRGVLHRDLKPANIMLGDFGEVYVLDWGVAKVVARDEHAELTAFSDDLDTGTGVIGTPAYMAPEQAVGEAIDERADVYSLGRVLEDILGEEPAAPELADLCAQATARDRDDRLASARELGERIQRYLEGDRDLARRRELARVHLESARQAFTRTGHEARALAMRDAGRALALDPELAGAAELVGRLMIEPPAAVPPEVEQQLASDAIASNQHQARISLWLYCGYFAFLPYIVAMRGAAPLAIAYTALVLANMGVVGWRARYPSRGTHWFWLRNAVLIAIIARVFSPVFIAPSLAAVVMSLYMYAGDGWNRRSAIVVALALTAAVLGEWGAELVGFLSSSVSFVPDGARLITAELPFAPSVKIAGTMAFIAAAIAAIALPAFRMRAAERALRRKLYVQTWQLQQLLR